MRQYGDVGVFEVAHPLDSADSAHDFSLSVPSHISFIASLQLCVAYSCGSTNVPGGSGKLVVVSGTPVPPDTRITAGPAEGAEVPDYYGNFEFQGIDDVAPPSEITFECKVDAGEWSECSTPYGPATTVDGWHTLSVRALDDMANVDPTPAVRRWRIDTLAPSKPKVVRKGATIRFSAKDRGTPVQAPAFPVRDRRKTAPSLRLARACATPRSSARAARPGGGSRGEPECCEHRSVRRPAFCRLTFATIRP